MSESSAVDSKSFQWQRGGALFRVLSWSSPLTIDDCKEAMRELIRNGDSSHILLRTPPGMSSKVERFESAQDVIDHLVKVDPRKIMDLRVKADHAHKLLEEKEQILRESQEVKTVERAIWLGLIAAPSAGSRTTQIHASQLLDWMYADARAGSISKYDPFRWRVHTAGAITLPKAIEEFQDLAQQAAAKSQAQRPVIVKIPPGFRSPELRFDNYDAVVEYLRNEKGVGKDIPDSENTGAQDKYEWAKQHLADAKEQVEKARQDANEAEAAASAAGV